MVPQHTPVSHDTLFRLVLLLIVIFRQIQYACPKLSKLLALQRLREYVRDHLVCRTVEDSDLVLLDSVCNKEVSNIQVPSALATGCTPIVL